MNFDEADIFNYNLDGWVIFPENIKLSFCHFSVGVTKMNKVTECCRTYRMAARQAGDSLLVPKSLKDL